MPSTSVRIGLLVCALALLPAASPVRPAAPSVVVSNAPLSDSALANAASGQSTLDVPIEAIAASPSGCAILDKDFPGLRKHAMYAFFKSMTLHQIAALSHGRMTPDMLAQARNDMSTLTLAASAPQNDIDDLDPPPLHSQPH